MERGTLDERLGAGPSGGRALGESLARPGVSAEVLVGELAQRERPAHSSAELIRHRLELGSEDLLTSGVTRRLSEVTVRVFPLEAGALHVSGHDAAD